MEVKPGYRQTEIGVIPEDWGLLRLVELIDPARSVRYGIVQPGKFDPRGRYMVRGQDYSDGWVEPSELFRVSPQVEEPFKNARIRTGDLLITIVGASTGRIAVTPNWLDGANLTQTTARLAISADAADSLYCAYVLRSWYGLRQVANYIKGGAQPGLNCGDIEKFLIPLPPTKKEQRGIAEALSDVDELLARQDQLISKKCDLKEAAMQQLLTGEIRLSGKWVVKAGKKQTEAGVIPEDWEVKSLGSVLRKGRLGGNYRNQSGETEKPLMKMGNLSRGNFDLSKVEFVAPGVELKSEHRLARGDVLFNTRNTLDLVGKVAIWRDELPIAYYNSNLMRLEFDTAWIASNDYANYALNTSGSVSRLRALATGTTSVAAIYTRDLMELPIIVPPKLEQTAIAMVLADMEKELTALYKRREKNRALKQGMMQELLAGKTRLI